MDFALSADEEAFAADVRRFLADHPPEGFRSTARTRATGPARTRRL